ncbi:hypothetical protein GTO89_10315 [Heliobacterium gestii]|uniref:Copper amine oxidase-like N-terminal domain-containing protein n=1 Tax=Heliomicrobium gestii TaxID=2699 RepID=A0A845LJ19_HELGE|nr:copper amine oxidase N-terminal domain-containing protein [Heliomicrobium gestii]MBM7867154.1 hypothetical protein [Heliomicrobium gestii]MZP43433.1 hypothetical protein [Heliomicrobium gestii]
MKRKIILLALIWATILPSPSWAFDWSQQAGVHVLLNGHFLNFDSGKPRPIFWGKRVIVPIRMLGEELGATVTWDNAFQSATMTKGDLTVLMTVDFKTAIINGKAFEMDMAPVLLDGNIMVPIRSIVESLGYTLHWESKGNTAVINGSNKGPTRASN